MPRRRPRLHALFALGPLLVALGCGGSTSGDGPSDSSADSSGGKCTAGATKKADDGCNNCTCGTDGQWGCTVMACLDGGFDTAGIDTAAIDSTAVDTGKVGDTGSDTGSDTGTDAAKDPRCPATWTAANTGDHDALCGDGLTCAYAEGSCACPPYCGGPPPGPDWKPTWTCTPKPPPRTDGCPDLEPADGSSCASDKKFCSYGDCCVRQYRCESGYWNSKGVICPP